MVEDKSVEILEMVDFLSEHEVVVNSQKTDQIAVQKVEKTGMDAVFGQNNCLNPNVLGQIVKDNKSPMALCALVFCNSVDELYHGLYDGVVIDGLRTLVFAGIVADASRKTIESIKL